MKDIKNRIYSFIRNLINFNIPLSCIDLIPVLKNWKIFLLVKLNKLVIKLDHLSKFLSIKLDYLSKFLLIKLYHLSIFLLIKIDKLIDKIKSLSFIQDFIHRNESYLFFIFVVYLMFNVL